MVTRARPRLVPAVASALLAGEAALLLLRPRDGIIAPRRVETTGYFSAAEIERSRAFRRPQLALGLTAGVVQLGVIGALARRAGAVEPPVRGPALAAARAGLGAAGITVALNAATLPLRALARRRSLKVGLATDSWGSWARDVVKAGALSGAIAGGAGAGGVSVLRRRPDSWWLPASGAIVVVSALGALVAPVLFDPLFNDFTPLEGEPREAVLRLAGEAGVDVGAVLSVDASRRTSAANAYVTGLGATKRVVLYDTLLSSFSIAERDLVIAHELAHVRHRDVQRQIAFLAITAPATTAAAAAIAARLDPRGVGEGRAGAGSLPALVIGLGAAGLLTTQASLRLSRAMERRADSFALMLAPDPDAFISFEQRIVAQNFADPDPPWLLQALLGTHPSTMERIGIAEATRRPARNPAAGPGTPAAT